MPVYATDNAILAISPVEYRHLSMYSLTHLWEYGGGSMSLYDLHDVYDRLMMVLWSQISMVSSLWPSHSGLLMISNDCTFTTNLENSIKYEEYVFICKFDNPLM